MLPGWKDITRSVKDVDALSEENMEKQMKRTEAIISSMTVKERRNPKVLNGSRKKRIAQGRGTTVTDVNQLHSQFRQMQKMMKQFRKPRGRQSLMNMFGGFR